MNKNSNNLYESFIVYSNDEDEDDDNYSNISEDFDRRVKDINLNLTRSLNGHGDDTISLYAYVDDECTVKKKISWEEWYLRKKIEGLKNEKQMKSKMQKKWEEDKKSHNRKNLSEKEKNKFLMDWWDKKKRQKEEYEEKLRQLTEANDRKNHKKKVEKEKADENYAKWLEQVKEKERAEKEKKKQEEEKRRLQEERIRQKREEKSKKLNEENKKKHAVRPLKTKKAEAIINGKLHSYYDWSTSPVPSFVNNQPWQS